MSKTKLLSLVLVLALTVSMFGCSADPAPTQGTTAGTEPPATQAAPGKIGHTVSVKTAGGMVLSDIAVYIYTNDTLTELADGTQTDDNGIAQLQLNAGAPYYIALSGLPEGYDVQPYYTFTGTSAEIVLTSSVVTDKELSGATLGLGDVMYDFTVTAPDGASITLSKLLEEKKMVLLNFWYSTCGPCANEFPYMQEAYGQYSEDVAVVALDPLENNDTVRTYQQTMGLSFPMAACPAVWSSTFGITGYPTSVVIDRYGVICLIEAGALTSLRPFTGIFEHFSSDRYEQKLFGSISELVSSVKPTYTMDSSDEISQVLDGGKLEVTYRPETDEESAEWSWPFIITEKNGEACLKASNQQIESSFSILYADLYLEAGQAVGFDYLISSEKGCDVLYVIVDEEDVYQISGYNEVEQWASCYPWVATESRVHEIALCYLKDGDGDVGDDTVYLKDLHVTDAASIDAPTYIPRLAATASEDDTYTYVDIVLNEGDGYYHVGTADGPLLLADLMGYTHFYPEKAVWDLVYNGTATIDGKNFYEDMVDYFSYASNSAMNGICTVNYELGEYLKAVARSTGFDGTEQEWLKTCKYYQVYGTDEQLADPIRGLANFSAFEATLGKDVPTNYFYYDRPIMPRGLLAKFTPEASGVYRITSRTDSDDGSEGWIFGEDRGADVFTYTPDERMVEDTLNVSMIYYMEAGRSYYIDIAFWDIYEIGYIYYDIEYVAPEYDVFRLASPGFFTYDTNATGDQMYALITGGIDVILGSDGYYYQDLGLDENGQQRYGSLIYADFTGLTPVFNDPIASVNAYDLNGDLLLDENGQPKKVKGMIEMGGFDFSKTEDDLYILSIIEKYDGDTDKVTDYLKQVWGEEYDQNKQSYRLDEVFAGIYHGRGEDFTPEIRTYLDKMITTGPEELHGCVPVDEHLAQLLQLVMDKYTFRGVTNSWTKMCYYYDHLGPGSN